MIIKNQKGGTFGAIINSAMPALAGAGAGGKDEAK